MLVAEKMSELVSRFEFKVDEHLGDIEIPVLDGLQAQGDIMVIPMREVRGDVTVGESGWTPVSQGGVEVLRGTAMGNPHTLLGLPGGCEWTTDVRDTEDLALGVIRSTAVVYLAHREHGYLGIAPGEYAIRRQREQADIIRMVAD